MRVRVDLSECLTPWCQTMHRSLDGYCGRHSEYAQMNPKPHAICTEPGCRKNQRSDGRCATHKRCAEPSCPATREPRSGAKYCEDHATLVNGVLNRQRVEALAKSRSASVEAVGPMHGPAIPQTMELLCESVEDAEPCSLPLAYTNASGGRTSGGTTKHGVRLCSKHYARYRRRSGLDKWNTSPAARIGKKAYKEKRRELVEAATIAPMTTKQISQRLSMFGKCWICNASLSDTYHVDHVKPLDKGGKHTLANFRPACAGCNLSKGADWPVPTSTTRLPASRLP